MFLEIHPFWQCYLPLAKKHGVPVVIGTIALRLYFTSDYAVGNPRLPSASAVEGHFIEPKMNFYDRLQNFYYEIESQVLHYLLKFRETVVYKELFNDHDLESTKISLLLINNHASVMPRVLAPNTISVGGIQVKSAKLNPLPKVSTFLN